MNQQYKMKRCRAGTLWLLSVSCEIFEREMIRYKARNERSFAATEGYVGYDTDACMHSALSADVFC